MILEFARVADQLRPWGVRMSLSIDLSSPMAVGHLPTFDPLDPQVIVWWQSKVDEIYRAIPDFGGFSSRQIRKAASARLDTAVHRRRPPTPLLALSNGITVSCCIAALSTTTTSTGEIRRQIALAPDTTTSTRSMESLIRMS